jgi:hypothetical protein
MVYMLECEVVTDVNWNALQFLVARTGRIKLSLDRQQWIVSILYYRHSINLLIRTIPSDIPSECNLHCDESVRHWSLVRDIMHGA